MRKISSYMLRKLTHPLDTLRAVLIRMEMRWLVLRNRFARSAVVADGTGPVVSLTTYGKRTQDVYIAIESIARGKLLPSRLILWLDDATILNSLPRSLRRLQRRGLEILRCKNYGPHKKYYPFVESQKEFDVPLVTADDDVIYPRTWLSALSAAHEQFPACVNCYRARVMKLSNGKIAPYREWPLCESVDPSVTTVATGVSGVIYPPALLWDLKSAGSEFELRCPRADDLWLHVQAVRSGLQIRQIQFEPIHFPLIPGSQETSLYAENCTVDDGNDRQLAATYGYNDLELLQSCNVIEPGAGNQAVTAPAPVI